MESNIIKESAKQNLPFNIHSIILKYLDLQTIISKMLSLSKTYNKFIREENYTIYKKFLQLFCINHNNKRDNLPAHCDIIDLIQECMSSSES